MRTTSGGLEPDPTAPFYAEALKLCEHLPYTKARVAMCYGHPCLDYHAIGDAVYVEVVGDKSLRPGQWTRELEKRALAHAEKALLDPGEPKWHATDELFGEFFGAMRSAFRAIDGLPNRMRRVYQADIVFGLSDEEIASVFKISTGCVRSHCSKAENRLSEQGVDVAGLREIFGTGRSIAESAEVSSSLIPSQKQEAQDEH